VKAEFYAASTREAAVYRGRPFQIEAAIAFGGDLPADQSARVIRFANRVPLLFQQSACSSFKAVEETPWKNYAMQQPRGSLPVGPLVVMIHMASVWVPFTSESKEAIADYDEIRKEMKLALMECGRKLGTYLRKRQKMRRESERRDVFERYIGEIAKALNAITNEDAKRLYDALLEQARKKTAVADQQLDEDGKVVREDDDDFDDDGVILVPTAIAPIEQSAPIAPISFEPVQEKSSGAKKPASSKSAPKATEKQSAKTAPAIVTKKDLAARSEEKPAASAKPATPSKSAGSSANKPFEDDDPRLF
jgi:DNA topoisomerase-6 subunit B